MYTNLLPLLLEFSPPKAALWHQWLKKIQNIHNGQELAYTNTYIPYMECQDHQLVVFLGLPVFHQHRAAAATKCLAVCHSDRTVLAALRLILAQTFVTWLNVADMVQLD
jgi:hypothetical protein